MEDQDISLSLVLWKNGIEPEIESSLICGGLDKFVSVLFSQFLLSFSSIALESIEPLIA